MGLKTRSKRLHVFSYISLVVGIVLFFALGLVGQTFLTDGGDAFTNTLSNLLTFGSSVLTSAVALVILLLIVIAIVVVIVEANKHKRPSALYQIIHLVILLIVSLGFLIVVSAYKDGISAWFSNALSEASTSGTAHSYLIVIGVLLGILLAVIYVLIQIFLYFETLAYIGKPIEEYCDDTCYLTEEEMRKVIREELLAFYGEKKPEEKVVEPVVKEQKEEAKPVVQPAPVQETVTKVVPVAPAPQVEEKEEDEDIEEPTPDDDGDGEGEANAKTSLAALHLTQADLDGNGRISFVERLIVAPDDILDIYNMLKNHILSYGVKSRISASGDTFRLHRQTFMKLTISGKKVKIYLALNPDDYKDSTIPFMDVGHKKSFAEIPFAFKVKSGLSIRRAVELIDQTMKKAGLVQKNEPKSIDYARDLVKELNAIKEGK